MGLEEEECMAGVAKIRRPEEPTQREFEEHMVLHLPFRAWCPHCVKGRAKSEPHKANKESEESTIPTIAMDYMWMKSEEESRQRKEEEAAEMRGMPILVITDSKSGYIDANVVPRKGECGFATRCGVRFLEFLGYKRVNFKTDQEESILSLNDSIKREWNGEIVEE